MAGTVFGSDGAAWAASSSVFYWVVDALAERVDDEDLAARLKEISEDNLGSLRVDDFLPAQRRALVAAAGQLPAVARRTLPASPAREEVVGQVQELSDLLGAR